MLKELDDPQVGVFFAPPNVLSGLFTFASFDEAEPNRAMLKWEVAYDIVRPSQASGYLTTLEYLRQHWQNKGKEKVSLII